jgi:NifU-like protein involved in Fe-S cluster formation
MLSAIASQHVHSPRNVGPLEGATHFGQAGTPGDGPYVQLWFIVEAGVIQKAAHKTNGCFASIASASVLAEVLQGRQVEHALTLSPSDVSNLLGGLPEGKGYCAEMAITALNSAFEENNT